MRGLAVHAAREPGAGRGQRLPFGATVVEVIDAAEIDELVEAQLRMIAQRRGDGDPGGRVALEGVFAGERRHKARRFAGRREQQVCEGVAHGLATVFVRAIFFCSWMMP